MGLMARELARRGFEVCSVDVNPEEQQVAAFLTGAPEFAGRIRFSRADGASLPFPDGTFGSAVRLDVLHHLVDGAAVLRELVRVVNPGGTIVLAEFSKEGFDLVARAHAMEGKVHPEGSVTMDWARGVLSGVGAEEVGLREGHLHRVAIFRTPSALEAPEGFASLGRRGLLTALRTFAANWLAHDGCWFLAAEEQLGTEAAIALDAGAWERFSAAEAKGIMAAFDIPEAGGLETLERVLKLRMYAFINTQRVEWSADRRRLRLFMEACRVQETRQRKGLPALPCKSVGEVQFTGLSRAIDPRIRVRCLYCPPDVSEHPACGWEFTLKPTAQE
jgi:SAM-dependent methyltransferase